MQTNKQEEAHPNITNTDTLWDKLNNTFWDTDGSRTERGFAGESYAFLVDVEAKRRCLRVINGSGVEFVQSEYVNFEITGPDTIKIENEVFTLKNNELTSAKYIYVKDLDGQRSVVGPDSVKIATKIYLLKDNKIESSGYIIPKRP